MPIPVIIDTDPGVDDVVALLYALASPELEILAILVSFGNTDLDASYDNVLKVYNALNAHLERYPEERARFPNFPPSKGKGEDSKERRPLLARGARGPLEGENHSAEYFHGRDGLSNISQTHPELTTGGADTGNDDNPYVRHSPLPAHEVALALVRARPARSVTYIALGPLTNLALMAREDATGETGVGRLGRVVVMGGALDVPGNTSPVAEFNFYADPYAVKELLVDEGTAFPKTRVALLPLDITTPHELPFPVYAERVDRAFDALASSSDDKDKGKGGNGATVEGSPTPTPTPTPLAHFTSAFLRRTRAVMREFGKDAMELHDVVAVWCATQNPPAPSDSDEGGDEAGGGGLVLQPGWEARRRLFQVERTGELTRGMLVVDRRDEAAAAAPWALPAPEGPTRFTTGDNRSEVQAALSERAAHELPAPVQLESAEAAAAAHSVPPPPRGIACITKTPGAEVLLRDMLARIWGVDL